MMHEVWLGPVVGLRDLDYEKTGSSLAFFACCSSRLAGTCPADIVLNYTISDGSGMMSHQKSDSLTGPIGTVVPGGVEYDFAFGGLGNNNWNWRIGQSTVSLILFGPQADPDRGEALSQREDDSAKPFTVIYNGPRPGLKSDQVEVEFQSLR